MNIYFIINRIHLYKIGLKSENPTKFNKLDKQTTEAPGICNSNMKN